MTMTITRPETAPALEDLRAMILAAGEAVGVSYEIDGMRYAASLRTVPGTYGHPAVEAHYRVETGQLTFTK